MRDIDSKLITRGVEKLCIDACCSISEDVENSIKRAVKLEKSESGRDILGQILENIQVAKSENIPVCQDTGMTVVFVELGQDAHITNGYLYDAINEGVRLGYEKGYLRKSVVRSPIDRINTKDNTPAVIHTEIVPGDKLRIVVAPKGAGSENMSAIKMLKPSDGIEGIVEFITSAVTAAGSNPCPPVILGVGIGGTFEKCALLAKKALIRSLDEPNPNPELAFLEKELEEELNRTGIGPQGLGGTTTCLRVNILAYPTHIAALPVAVNIQCHASRHKEIVL